jgi:hypothetical protein
MPAIVHDRAPDDWDAWLSRHRDQAGFLQCTGWAAVASALNATNFYFLEVRNGDTRNAAALAGHVPLSASVRRWPARAVERVLGRGGGMLDLGDGPVLENILDEGVLRALLETIDSLSARLGVDEIRFAGIRPASVFTMESMRALMVRFGYEPREWRSAVVDLAQGDDKLLKSVRQAARKGIRKCRELGIAVEVFAAAEAGALDSLFEAEFGRIDRRNPTYGRIIATLKADVAGAYRFFVARKPDRGIVAVLGSYRLNGTATEITSLRSADKAAQRFPAQDLLHWEAFRHYRSLGDTRFDLAGYNPNPRNAKEEGIRRFKQKWGGTEHVTWSFVKDLRRGAGLRRLFGRAGSRARSLAEARDDG